MASLTPKITVRATLTSAENNLITITTPALDVSGVIRLTPFVQGEKGDPGAAINTFTHQQSVPASVWTIDHNLGFWPDVTVFDTNGAIVDCHITNPSLNRTTLTFSEAIVGTARMM